MVGPNSHQILCSVHINDSEIPVLSNSRIFSSLMLCPVGDDLSGTGLYLDPTGDCGSAPSNYPSPGPWWPWAIETALSFANEPPPGDIRGGPNCTIENGADEADLLFQTSRDISQGEEILIDYGSHYDRSGYAS